MVMELDKKLPAMECVLNGVRIESRYNYPTEIEVMMRVFHLILSGESTTHEAHAQS
jgi:hypothetical protein